jgi:hypothetical protein
MSFGANKQKVTTAVAVQEAGNSAQQDLYVVFRAAQPGVAYRPLLKAIRFLPK